jgi:hypothetical protein
VKLFAAQRRRETAKLLQFLELIRATFNFGGNAMQGITKEIHCTQESIIS